MRKFRIHMKDYRRTKTRTLYPPISVQIKRSMQMKKEMEMEIL